MMLIMPLSFALSLTWGVPVLFTWAIFWLSPLMVICLAAAWQHERPSRASWIGIVLGSLGVVAVTAPTLPASPFAPFAPLVMALSFSVYIVMTQSLRTEHLETNLFYTAVGVFAVLTLFMPSVWIAPSLHDIEMIVGIGAVGFVSLLLLDQAVRCAPVSATSPALYSQVACVSASHADKRPPRASACAHRYSADRGGRGVSMDATDRDCTNGDRMSRETIMTAAEAASFLEELARQEVQLWVEGGDLRFPQPAGALTSELRTRISANRASLVASLEATASSDSVEPPAGAPQASPGAVHGVHDAPKGIVDEAFESASPPGAMN